MPQYDYSPEHIHLPPNRFALSVISYISSIGFLISAVFALSVLIFGNGVIGPVDVAAVLLSALSVLPYYKASFIKTPKLVLLILGGMITALGAFSTITAHSFLFLPIGLAIIITGSKIPHRFHLSQLILFGCTLFSLVILFWNILNIITLSFWSTSLWSSLLFSTLALSLMLVKGDRGFVGLFTTDSQSSQLARRSVFSFGILLPLISWLILIAQMKGLFDQQLGLALLLVSFAVLLIVIFWINVKSLYPSEVERFLMQEALRVNNITLEQHAHSLSSQVVELESAKKEIADKLNYQQTLSDIVDAS